MATQGSASLLDTARSAFWTAYQSYNPVFADLVYTADSNSTQETYAWLGYAPTMRKMVGGRFKETVPELSYTIKNYKYEATVPIAYETWRFGRNDEVARLLAQAGEKARAHPDKLMTALLTDNSTGYDSLAFAHDSHVDPGASYTTAQDNNLTSAAATGTQPTDLEFATGVRACMAALYGYKDGAGDPFWVPPEPRYIAMVPPAYAEVAKQVMTSSQLTGPIGNDLQGRFEVRVNQFDTSTAVFWMFLANVTAKPFIHQMADPVVLEDDIGGDNEFNTKERHFGPFFYGGVGVGQWRTAVKYTYS